MRQGIDASCLVSDAATTRSGLSLRDPHVLCQSWQPDDSAIVMPRSRCKNLAGVPDLKYHPTFDWPGPGPYHIVWYGQ